MNIGYFSPMPPVRTGVADYSASLLAALGRHGTVRLNDPGADIALYHLGNNQLHRPIYERALKYPGVVVLHDAVLHHFFLGSLSESEYVAEFEYNYGRWSAGAAERLWRNRARSGVDPAYFQYPMLKRVVERSRAMVVHNPGAARMAREHAPAARVFEIPHLLLPMPETPAYEAIRLRACLGVAPSTCLFGVFGHLRESKRLGSVLRAFTAARDAGAPVALILAGAFASSDLARSLSRRLDELGVPCTGHIPANEFAAYAHAVDACINLRFPAAGETSGIAIRLMNVGKPVLMTRSEEVSNLPETAAIRVDAGTAEADLLAEYMIWLARFRDDAAAIGARARRHVEEFHAPERVAQLYWRALTEARA